MGLISQRRVENVGSTDNWGSQLYVDTVEKLLFLVTAKNTLKVYSRVCDI
jgi:hypothetical protein